MPEPIPSVIPTKAGIQTPTTDASKAMTLFVMIVTALYFGKEVLVPVTLALLLAFILAPLVVLLRRIHLGRTPSVLLAVILALSIITAVGGVIGSQIGQLSDALPQYVSTVEAKVAAVKDFTVGRLSRLASSVGRRADGSAVTPNLFTSAPSPSPQSQVVLKQSGPTGTSPLDLIERYLSPILSPLATLGIVFVIAVFALLQREDLRDRLIRLIGANDLHRTTLAIDDAGRRLSRYFITQLSINSVFGLAVGLGLLLIGVPSPVLWGILSALLRFVPYVGSPISAILPLALAAAVEPGWSMMIYTGIMFLVTEGITGQVIEPLIYGHSTGLSPFSVVVAAIFWSWVWGPIGLILSTPLTLCLVVMGRHIKRFEFLDVMLGDRPALTPIESFYQRILAGDADEAQAYAEALLKDRSLSNYYDEVALKGLQLAASDAQSGALDQEQLDRVKSTIMSVIRGLESRTEKPLSKAEKANGANRDASDPVLPGITLPDGSLSPVPARSGVVLCISGRGPLDDAAAALLVQVLGRQGIMGRTVDYNDVSRDRVSSLDVSDVVMICIFYLDISGNPAHLRYLINRLHQHVPQQVEILVGLWPAEDLRAKDAETRIIIGADYYTTSLEQTIATCLEATLKKPSSEELSGA